MINNQRQKANAFSYDFFLKNHKGLSAIIVTLILILLSIVVATVVWVVVNNIVQGESGRVDVQAKCLSINVEAETVTNASDAGVSPVNYNVVLTRSAGGESIDGVKIVFTNATGGSSYVHTAPGNIAPLATTTVNTGAVVTITNANKVKVSPYFVSDAGEDQDCQVSTEFEFTLS